MSGPKSSLDFRLMALEFRCRDVFLRPERVLREGGIKRGHHVLDYGCGPGSCALAAARIVGEEGKVFAADVPPLAIRQVEGTARKRRLSNVKGILTECQTGLPDECIDVALLYDVFHELSSPDDVLRELHRVLKPQSVLSFSDHHVTSEEIVSRVTSGNLFRLQARGKRTHTFLRD
jgi:ubiquinone/menaquinone biosynthesis C-methylase UbiE